MKHSSVPPESTLRIEVHGLMVDGVEVDDATVTLQAVYHRGTLNEVDGMPVPITLEHVTGTDGDYRANIGWQNGLEPGRWYTARVLAVAASGDRRPFREDIFVTTKDQA